MSCTTTVRVALYIVPILLLASPVGAIPITWTLSDVVFVDGSTATGSFVYDADINVSSDVSITTNRASYETQDLWAQAPFALFLIDGFSADNTGKPFLELIFRQSLTNLGGTVPLLVGAEFGPPPSSEGTCQPPILALPSDCVFSRSFDRHIITGSVTAPEPTSLLLLGLGLAAIVAARRWRS